MDTTDKRTMNTLPFALNLHVEPWDNTFVVTDMDGKDIAFGYLTCTKSGGWTQAHYDKIPEQIHLAHLVRTTVQYLLDKHDIAVSE